MTRKKTVARPPKRTPPKAPPAGTDPTGRPAALSINLAAMTGRDGLVIGARVRILGGGLYAGETAVIERLAGGVVPAAQVRTEAGRRRTVRTIDLEPVRPGD